MNRLGCGFLCSILITALLVVAPLRAQDSAPDKTSAIDKIFSWVQPGMPGCVAAASQHGKRVLNRAWGLADLERNVPLSTDSMFDAASIRKQFVAAAILLLVEENRLALSDDVHKYIPELPDYDVTITLDHMLTHTSGLRDWVPLLEFNRGSEPAMPMILRQRALNFAPGEEWSYSNSGYVLLTEIVARVSEMPFSAFVRTRLFERLEMKATMYVDDLRQVIPSRALAYEPQGKGWRMAMRIDNERGGQGALFSTARNLVTWNDALASGRLGAFVTDRLHEPATLNNGRTLGYARGIMLDTNYAGPFFWHGGGVDGYRSVLTRFPARGISVAVLCNAGEASDDRDAFAARIFDLFAPPTGTRPTPTAPLATEGGAPIEGLDVASRAGLFFNERTGDPLRLVAGNSRLAIAGGGPLIAVTKDRFRNARPQTGFMSNDAFELTFLSPDRFDLRSMEGQTTRFRRAQAYVPTTADLKALTGRYDSGELRATLEVTPGKAGVLVRLNDPPPGAGINFQAVERDTFMAGTMMLRFRRDQAGTIAGVDLTTPALRKVAFTRASRGV
jgi:CubicO group peptidase (beta-lactamase class C family)